TICPSARRSRRWNRPTSSTSAPFISTTRPSFRWLAPRAWRKHIGRIISEESKRADEQNKDQGQPQDPKIVTPSGEPAPPPPPSNRRYIVIGVVVLLAIAAGLFYWHSTYTEDTDDAQVDGNLYQISSRIAGHVVAVNVSDNQMVKKGDVLAEIDPADYQVALDQAEADLAA